MLFRFINLLRNDGMIRMVTLISIGLLISYADRSNLSIAIIPLSKELNLNESEIGWVLSTFFYGYIITQIWGGQWADQYGGKRVLLLGGLTWSIITLLTPLLANFKILGLTLSRILLGLGEGVAFPAAHALLARWVPISKRSTSVGIITSASYAGSPLASLLAAPLAQIYGWRSIFFLFGSVSLVWCLIFYIYGEDGKLELEDGHEAIIEPQEPISTPWSNILTCKAIHAILINQFTSGWSFYILLNWLPLYFKNQFKMDLGQLGWVSAIPYASQGIVGILSGLYADHLISKGHRKTLVRTRFQLVGMFVPSLSLLLCSSSTLQPSSALILLTIAMGSSGCTIAGLSCSHHDIAPRHAGLIFALGNVSATLAAPIAMLTTGYMVSGEFGWGKVFMLAAGIRFIGGIVWWRWGGGDKILIQ